MGYFDLNIPYPEPSLVNRAAVQSNRTRLVVKAMELGYTGIAYNRTIKGVMSDQHSCSMTPLTLSSLLNILPFLSSSAKLHRHLLGIPLSTPFRQYTRLTVCVDSPSHAQSLNSGNPILKTYDLVAVKPLNQACFDLACQTLEVDIISIDFSNKLPFRLKQPMVKAAAQRGVCFEVTYSSLFADIQLRRQLISSAKLLMDWTRGQNIVLASAAPSVNELRGPCDVANLLSLFGLSKERANAAISKNCRILLANSLRKKRFYKEAIRVEVLSSHTASQSREDQYQELLKWDPISSGEGDILLDDMEKSFSASGKASKPAKAIDFVSVVDSLPSHGFEMKDFLPADKAFPVCPDNKVNLTPVAEKLHQSIPVSNDLTEQPNNLDVCPEPDKKSLSDTKSKCHVLNCDNIFEKNILTETTEAFNCEERDILVAESIPSLGFQNNNFVPANNAVQRFSDNKARFQPVTEKVNQPTPLSNNLTVQPNGLDICPGHDESSQSPKQTDSFLEKNIHSRTTDRGIDTSTNATKLELKSSIYSSVDFIASEAKVLEPQSNVSISSNTLDTIKPPESEKLCSLSKDAELVDAHNGDHTDHEVDIFTSSMDVICPVLVDDKHNSNKISDVNLNKQIDKVQSALPNEDLRIAEQTVLELNTPLSETSIEVEQFDKRETDAIELDEMQKPTTSHDEMKIEDDSTVAEHILPDVIMKDKKLGEVSTDFDQFASVHSISGQLRLKRKTSRGPLLFPFKRLLNPLPFKKKGKKCSMSRTKLK